MRERVLVNTAQTVSATFGEEDAPQVSSTPVTVRVARLDGTVLVVAGSTNPGLGVGEYLYVVPPQAVTDRLAVDFTGTVNGLAQVVSMQVEVVGGWYFTLNELRTSEGLVGDASQNRPLSNKTQWPTWLLREARQQAEDEAEGIMGWAFVERVTRETVEVVDNRMMPSRAAITAVRSAVNTRTGLVLDVSSWTVEGAVRQRIWAANVWPSTRSNAPDSVTLVYSHGGLQILPVELATAVMTRARHFLARRVSKQPEQTERFVVTDQGTFGVALPKVGSTGNAHVDAVYRKYSCRVMVV